MFDGPSAIKNRKRNNAGCLKKFFGYGGNDSRNKFVNLTKEQQ